MKKFHAKGQARDSQAVLPMDKLTILRSNASNAETQVLNHCLKNNILRADLIISHTAIIINHGIIIEICHSKIDVTRT